MPSNFRNLLTNWYITENKVSNKQELNEDVDNSYYNFIVNISLIIYLCILFYTVILSLVDFITNIILKRLLFHQDRENIMKNLPNFKSELLLLFVDIGLNLALVYSQMGWYELATYTIEESDGIFSKVHLHIGNIITIHEENNGEYYAIIKRIFKYKGNNDKFYVFITIDWFNNTNRIHNVLKCPLYRIQSIQDMR
ncbi:hypothetical protein RclHR1_31160001 [Rhizophagus clarus]|uniref:Uncharacterized protein n=1 Tax=Rhizophagus clarus TaxID=94130 RepID=A0A2Z6RLJ8_9GLOM|nr:hypothetical protein RclHR1_31160001 [Rhizophagus clarus]GES72607.1 hypothetical protein GLOIN_2v1886362 [Rhizophagus clarus]